MDTEQKEAMDSWPEFPRAEQFMLPENGNRVYRAIITEEQYNQARDAIAAMQWRPIETAPTEQGVMLWIKSTNNTEFGRLAVNVHKKDGDWYGRDCPMKHYGEYGSHWMPLPPQPTGEL